jgi:hypothetical protein
MGCGVKMGIFETVRTLIDRLKNIDESAGAAEFEELAVGVDFLNEADTYENALAFADLKKNEISQLASEAKNTTASSVVSRSAELQTAKENSLSAIPDVSGILSAAIDEKSKIINGIVDNFAIPSSFSGDSTICAEISDNGKWKDFLENGSIPIIFGILSRYNDYDYGAGSLANAISAPGSGSFNPDQIFQMLIGTHNYTTEYAGFYKSPKLCFLQGEAGNFIYRELYTTPALAISQYHYGRMAVGCIFVKNTTDENITRSVDVGGSFFCYAVIGRLLRTDSRRVQYYGNVYSTSSGGLAISVGHPLGDDLSWSGLTHALDYTIETYYVDRTTTQLYPALPSLDPWSGSLAVTVPAHATVAIMPCTTAQFLGSADDHYSQFLHWRLSNVRGQFLGNGLEVDFEMTKKAIQSSGLSNTADLWSNQ